MIFEDYLLGTAATITTRYGHACTKSKAHLPFARQIHFDVWRTSFVDDTGHTNRAPYGRGPLCSLDQKKTLTLLPVDMPSKRP